MTVTETTDRSPLLSLLEPFPPEMVGKLPRVTCKACSDFHSRCDEHKKQKCDICGSFISTKHIHLDFVGHADVTRRLLEVDPAWEWDPVAEDEHGLPVFDTDDNDNPVGLWIKLTVLGVTRRGYGSCPSKQSDAVKVLIGDALRNAAMRFGVALDLWAKGDRADPAAENAVAAGGTADRRRQTSARQAPPEQRTDHGWLADIEQRIAAAQQEQELVSLANEVRAKVLAGRCEVAHEARLFSLGKRREQELSAETAPSPQVAPPTQPAPSAAHSSAPRQSVSGGEPADENGFETRLKAVKTIPELDQLKADVMAAFKANKLDPTAGNSLLRSIKARAYELEEAA